MRVHLQQCPYFPPTHATRENWQPSGVSGVGETPEGYETDYRSRVNTDCDIWFVCASMATPACCRIWALVIAAVSCAKSASWIRLREALRFSDIVCRLAIAESKRFCTAPRVPRKVFTVERAASTRLIISLAFATVVTDAELSAALPSP